MALPKRRLRWILLIVILVLPLTIISGVAWFVASDTWLHQTEKRVSESIGLPVRFGDLAVAGGNQHHFKDVNLSDVFTAKVLQADGYVLSADQRIIGIDQFNWTLNQGSRQFLIALLQAHAQQEHLTVVRAVNGKLLSLDADFGLNALGIFQLTASGVLSRDQLAKIAEVFLADVFVQQLPDFIVGDQIEVDHFLIRCDTNNLSWQWELRCHWAQGALDISAQDGVCTVQAFSDERLPLFTVIDNKCTLAGMQYDSAQLAFDASLQVASLNLKTKSGDAWRFQIDARQDHCILKITEGLLKQELGMLVGYFPQAALNNLPQQWQMSGSSLKWSEHGFGQGQLQLQAEQHALRGSWALKPHLTLQDALVKAPGFSCAIQEIVFSQKTVDCTGLMWTQVPKRIAPILSVLKASDYTYATNADERLEITMGETLLTVGLDEYLALNAPVAAAELVDAFIVASGLEKAPQYFASGRGRLKDLSAYLVKGDLRISAELRDVVSAWPLANWRLPSGKWSYWNKNNLTKSWIWMHPSIRCSYTVLEAEKPGKWTTLYPSKTYNWHWQSACVQALAEIYLSTGVTDE